MRLTLLLMLVLVIWCRDIESRIPYEKSGGLQSEAKHIHRHNRPVLGPHDMVGSKGVPHDEIGSHERALLLYVHWQAISTPLLVWVVSSSIALSWVIRGDPEVVAYKTSSLPLRRSLVEEGKCIRPRHEFVRDGLTQNIEHVRIDNLPVTSRTRLNEALCVGFAGEQCFPRGPGVPAWILLSPGERLTVDLNY